VTTDGAIFGIRETRSFGEEAGVEIDMICEDENSANCEAAKSDVEMFELVDEVEGEVDEPEPGTISQ